jgi:hypothetical protein
MLLRFLLKLLNYLGSAYEAFEIWDRSAATTEKCCHCRVQAKEQTYLCRAGSLD